MFPFDLFEKALLDKNLSDKDKVLVSYIMKKISVSKTDEVEMYIGFLANEVMNCSDSSVKRALRSITEKGYIVKRNGRGKGNKKPVIIRLADEKSRSQVTLTLESRGQNEPKVEVTGDLLKNSNKNNTKNSHSITSPCSTSTCGENNQTNTEEKMNDTAENMTEKSDAMTDAMTSNESAKNETIEKVRLTSDELRKRNEYISSIYRKLDTSLNFLNSLRDRKMYDETFDEVYRTFQDAEAHEDWFTDGQWKKLEIFNRRFLGITEYKDRYFNGTRANADADAVTVSMEEETNLNAETDENGDSLPQCNDTPAPRRQTRKCEHVSKEQAIKWVWTTLGKYDSLEEWENAMTKRFNKTYGDWDYGKDANACRFWNIINKEASDYYWNLSEAQAKKKMEMDAAFDEFIKESGADEIINVSKQKMNDEEWHEKYGHLLKH